MEIYQDNQVNYNYNRELFIHNHVHKNIFSLLSDHLFSFTGRGMFVKSVDNDPAKSDSRVQPGDELIQVSIIIYN